MILLVVLQLMVLCLGVRAQAPTPQAPMRFDPNCTDKIDSCWNMPESNCQDPYEAWAQEYCPNRCGYCIGVTTPAPPCVNTITNCEDYDKSVCNDPDYKTWANDNCRYFCRFCSAAELNRLDSITTTISPQDCVDKADCRQYGSNACADEYKAWARDNCPQYCGICPGIPTPPALCEDKIPNCNAYDADTCTNPDYKLWVEDNCRKYCGLCVSNDTTPSLAPIAPAIPTTAAPGTQAPNNIPTKVPSSMTATIAYKQPTPAPPGKRDAAAVEGASKISRRQFHASHHHQGSNVDCWDSTDPACDSQNTTDGKTKQRKLLKLKKHD